MTADAVLALVAEQHGVVIGLEGPCPGGENGAFYGRCTDGRRVVFKWSEETDAADRLPTLVGALRRLHGSRYPLPLYGPALAVAGAVFVAQEACAGRWSDAVTHALFDDLLRCNRMQVGCADAIDDEPWADFLVRTLTEGADGWCLHEPLRAHSPETRRVLDHIEQVGRDLDRSVLPHGDLVHLDFHHRNALQHEDGTLSVIVDWEGARQGDAVFDLVMLAMSLSVARVEPDVSSPLWDEIFLRSSAGTRAGYVSHVALRRLDWAIGHHPEEVPMWLAVAETELRRFS